MRFRPTFTLCPKDANRIEVGEDVAPIAPSSAVPMKMANFDIPLNQPFAHEVNDYLSTPNNNLRCTRCHGNALPGLTGDTPLLSSPFDPFTTQRRNLLPLVIYTTEPTRKAIVSPSGSVGGQPVARQTLEQICTQIQTTLENNPFAYGFSTPIHALCSSLAKYAEKRSCGNGVENVRCSGVTGGGIFVQNGMSSNVALEFSGQAGFEPESPERAKIVDVDGTLTAFNSTTQTTINAVVLSSFEQVAGEDGDGIKGEGNYVLAGAGKAWVNGVTTTVAVRISFNKENDVSRFSITSSDGTQFYAGGSAIGVRFTVVP